MARQCILVVTQYALARLIAARRRFALFEAHPKRREASGAPLQQREVTTPLRCNADWLAAHALALVNPQRTHVSTGCSWRRTARRIRWQA